MKPLTAFAALVLTLCCGLSAGFGTPSTAHDISYPTNTPRPTLAAQSTPVYAPQIAAVEFEEQYPMIEATDLLAIIAALSAVAALIVSIVAFMRANPQATPAALDVAVAERIDTVQQNREAMAVYESALQKQTETIKMLYGGLAMGMRMLAAMTPSKAIEEVAELFTDIETPGAPVVVVTPPADPAENG